MRQFHNPNLGVSPYDPGYDEDFNEEDEYERYLDEISERGDRDEW